jgi:hypothetical protein
MTDRKRLLRLAIQEVTVTAQSTQPRSAQVTILWSGGLTTSQTTTAERLGVSTSLIHVWIQHGVLASEQRTTQSDRWVRSTDADMVRLDGRHDCSRLPTVNHVMRRHQWSREQVWQAVRDGAYSAYRQRSGQLWQWRLRRSSVPQTNV